jgi:hypothetical protein
MWRTAACVFASAGLLSAQGAPQWTLVRASPGAPNEASPSLERLILGPSGRLISLSERLFLTSRDGGMRWSVQSSSSDLRIEALAFSSRDKLWGGAWDHGATSFGWSSDGDRSWKKAFTLNPGPAAITDIAFFDETLELQ